MRNKVFMLILVVGSFFGFLSALNSSPRKQKMIGLQLYSIRKDLKKDMSRSLDSVAKSGYTFVETAGYDNGKFYGFQPKAFKEELQNRGLLFLSSHTGKELPDSTQYEKTMRWWDETIAAHKEAGVPYIVQPWMGSDAYESPDVLKRYCHYFNEVGAKCKQAGIRFGYHNHSREFEKMGDETIYDYMLANTDSSNVFFQIDLYWVVKGGADPVAYLTKYPGRFILWHVKDEKEIGASGLMDFEAIYNQAEVSGMQYAIVEQEDFTNGSFAGIRQSCDFIQNASYIKDNYAQ